MPELNLVLLGPPGSGKGTQGERLNDDLRLPYYATGDILRGAVRDETELGRPEGAALLHPLHQHHRSSVTTVTPFFTTSVTGVRSAISARRVRCASSSGPSSVSVRSIWPRSPSRV